MENGRVFEHVLITGASSGIGEALANVYAESGARLSLAGRDPARIAAVAQACRSRGATVSEKSIDVTDQAAMEAWIREREAAAPLDLVVANAGVSGGMDESHDHTRRIFRTNVDGVFNTVLPAIDPMKNRRRGHIAIVSSLAAFRGVAGAPAYGGSKAAVRVWGEGLRGALAAENVGVTVVCPGFVVSRMTDRNNFPMPFIMTADKAARLIQRGIAKNKGRIAFPWPMWTAMWFVSALPDALAGAIANSYSPLDKE